MKIYIHKPNEFLSDITFTAYMGCLHLGYTIVFFCKIEEVPINSIVIGFSEDTITYLKRCNINVPKPLGIPKELSKYTLRNVKVVTFEEFLKSPVPTEGIFIKPHDQLKLFPSGVIKHESSKRNGVIPQIPLDTLVEVCDFMDMQSEYRVFVRRGKIVGIKHYQGDFKMFPNTILMDKIISEYGSAPIGYTIDFAITDNFDTVLVECNDGWSIGPYGLEPDEYIKLLIDRWIEIYPACRK